MWSVIIYFMCVTYSDVLARTEEEIEDRMHQALTNHFVISEIPKQLLKVRYPGGYEVDLGNHLTPRQVKHMPSVSWPADPNAYYTICMSDPDAPSYIKFNFKEWQHWVVVNIPGNDTSKGDTLTEYLGAIPLPKSGFHRYVFLLYKQPSKITFYEARLTHKDGKKRERFAAQILALKYDMGHPIAGNYFLAEFDNEVYKTIKQLDVTVKELEQINEAMLPKYKRKMPTP